MAERSKATLWRRGEGRKRNREDVQQFLQGRQVRVAGEVRDDLDEAPIEVPVCADDESDTSQQGGSFVGNADEANVANLSSSSHFSSDSEDTKGDSDWSNWSESDQEDSSEEDNADLPFREDDIDDNLWVEAGGFEDEDSDEDEEEGNAVIFSLDNAVLSTVVRFQPRTVKEIILLELALSLRHGWTYESLIDSLKTKNTLAGQRLFPTSKSELWSVLGRSDSVMSEYVYCDCGYLLGKKKSLPEVIECSCGKNVTVKKARHFYILSLEKQLRHFLSNPGVQEAFNDRATRQIPPEGCFADIFDGENFKKINLGPHDHTYVMSTDGCKSSKGAKRTIQPFYLRLNNTAPNLRQKFIFLAGVYVGKGDPDMTAFLLPIVKNLNKLSTNGVVWEINGQQVTSRFFPTCLSVDGKARYQCLHMVNHNSEYGCTFCKIKGVRIDNTMRYPIKEHPEVPPYEYRTHEDMKRNMLAAERERSPVFGHKGVTPLLGLKGFDLSQGQAFDDLHNFYECTAAVLTELVIKEVPKLNELGQEAFMELIDARLLNVNTPSKISRKPGTCKLKNRCQLKGTEWRNWIVYYSVPCLQGLVAQKYIRLFELLSMSIFLLSKDVVLRADIELAKQNIIQFLTEFEENFGVEKTRLNMHASLHAVRCLEAWGPLWCYTTMSYESWNKKVIDSVKSPSGAALQIINRHMLVMAVRMAMLNNDLSEDIRDQMDKILGRKLSSRYTPVKEHMYVSKYNSERRPTEEELQILQREGFRTGLLRIHKKLLWNSVSYSARKNTKEDSRSDNSIVFTHQNTFCSIMDIVTFESDNTVICGLFVLEHSVQARSFQHARHILKVLPAGHDLSYFIRAEDIRVPVVSMTVLQQKYFVPMPNTYEID